MSTMPSKLPVTQLMGLIRMLPPEVKQTLAQLLAQEQGQAAAGPGLNDDEEDLDLWSEDEDEDEWEDEDEDWDDWDEDEGEEDEWDEEEEEEGLDRRHLLAAETFGYNYDAYEDHVGNVDFDDVMPRQVDSLEQAERESWDDERLAVALDRDVADLANLRDLYRRAVQIVDAPTPVESFRRGVRFSIQDAIEEGLNDPEAVERLVGEICSRAADLGYLLEVSGEPLAVYSEELRREEDISPYPPLSGEQAEG